VLGEQPREEGGFGVGPLPRVVVDAGIFGVEGAAAGFAARGNAIPGEGDRDGLVGIAVEIPQRSVGGGGAIFGGGACATRDGGGEEIWTLSDHVPHTSAAHGLPGDVDAAAVDGKFAEEGIDDLQRKARALAQAWQDFRGAFGLREVVADPALIGLRDGDVAGEALLVFREEPDASAEDVAEAELLEIVVAEAAAAVEIDDEREFSVGGRGGFWTEEAIGHDGVTLVSARFELFFQGPGLLSEGVDEGEALGRIGSARREGWREVVSGR